MARGIQSPTVRGKRALPGRLPELTHVEVLLNRITDNTERERAQAALRKLRKDGVDTESLCSSLSSTVELCQRLRKTDVLRSHSPVARRKISNLPRRLKQLSHFMETNQLHELLRTAFFFGRAQNRNTLVEVWQKCDRVTIEKDRKYGDLFLCLPALLRQLGEDLEQLLRNPGVGVMDFASQITWICGEVKRQSNRQHYSEISDLLRPLQRVAGQRELDADALKTVVARELAKRLKLRQITRNCV